MATVMFLGVGGCAAHAIIPTEQSLELTVHEKASGKPIADGVISLAPLPLPDDIASLDSHLDRVTEGGFNRAVTDADGRATLRVNTTIYAGLFDRRRPLGDRVRGRSYLIRVHAGSSEDVLQSKVNAGNTVCGSSFCVTFGSVGRPTYYANESDAATAWEPSTSEKARAVERARQEVSAREVWAESASYEVLQRPGMEELWVLVRRSEARASRRRSSSADGRVDRIVRMDKEGHVIEYREND